MEKTVGAIAAESPASVRVFEKYNIDYCCGGKIPLSEACRNQGVSPEQLTQELDAAISQKNGNSADWSEANLDALIDHILAKHHAYLKSELPRLSRLLAKVASAHGAKHGETLLPLGTVFEGLWSELDAHLMKEEMVLFPLIRKIEASRQSRKALPPSHCGSVGNPIRVMVQEHDSAGDALAQIRLLTQRYTPPADACNSFRALYHGLSELEADLHQHIHLENNILFPRAVRMEAEQ